MKIKLGEYLEKLIIETIKNMEKPSSETFEIKIYSSADGVAVSINARQIFWIGTKMLEEVEC